MRLTENFILEEFACKDGTPVPKEYINNVQILADKLQAIHNWFSTFYVGKIKITINSGYRTPKHNKKEGGSPRSKHLTAEASDINVWHKKEEFGVWEMISPDAVYNVIDRLEKSNIIEAGGLGAYNSFTHTDIRGIKGNGDFYRWDNRSEEKEA